MWHICFKTKNLKYSYFFSATDGQFNGVRDVFTHLMKTEGPKALYKGAAPVFVRAFVANSCCFMGYELAMWGLNKAMWWKKKKKTFFYKINCTTIPSHKKKNHNGVKGFWNRILIFMLPTNFITIYNKEKMYSSNYLDN